MTTRLERVHDLATHPVAFVNAAVEAPLRAYENETAPRRDLREQLIVEVARPKAVHVKEHIEPLPLEELLHYARDVAAVASAV